MLKPLRNPRNKKKRRILIALLSVIDIALIVILAVSLLSEKNIIPNSEPENAVVTQIAEKQIQKEEATTQTDENEKEDELLILVNYNNPLPDDYKADLVSSYQGCKVDNRCKSALEEMMKAAKEDGCRPYIISAYRSIDYQKSLYNRKISEYTRFGYTKQEAEEEASGWVAYPGTSEHHLGLAVDIVDSSNRTLDESQEKTKTQKWLIENCYDYGFILRYPNNKKDITHINYEPWHYRYVGKENAKRIKESGLCLEEYLGKD